MKDKLLYFIIYKPYKILSQFSDEDGNRGLGSLYKLPKDVYPVGRLDLDSEGLLLLTNDKRINNRLLDPKNGHSRTYWVEVEGEVKADQLQALQSGVEINASGKRFLTLPSQAEVLTAVSIEEREPPVNRKKHPKTTWMSIQLKEGKNRQVRKMTAKVGHPTLRLLRVAIEDLSLFPLKPGDIRQISQKALLSKLHLDFG
ncbi:MAG: pseudouridine synthase [Cyclobacteriaceae bacterium]|nr:pseudouridine synthase [Cyclobacteriaceae bacterium HetDA_MAG_MS6]